MSKYNFNCKKSFGYVVGYWIFELVFRLCMYQKWDFFQLSENDADNEYLYIIFLNISDLLSFLIILYHTKCQKKIQYQNKINEKRKYLKFFGLFILDLLARLSFYIFHKIFDIDNEEVSPKFARDVLIFIDIEMRFLFYILIINGDVYKHKIYSIIIILIIFILLILLDVINLNYIGKYNMSKCFYYILILLPRSFLFPFVDTIAKKYMTNEYILPSEYMLSRGIIEFIYITIITLILLFTSNLNYTSDIFSSKLFIVSFIYIISCFIKAYLLLNVIYYYSSQSVCFLIISESLAGSINEIINFFKDEKNMSKAINIIISSIEIILVILIGIVTMIYEEIIIIRIYGLDKNIENSIIERAENDDDLASSKIDLAVTMYIPPKSIND